MGLAGQGAVDAATALASRSSYCEVTFGRGARVAHTLGSSTGWWEFAFDRAPSVIAACFGESADPPEGAMTRAAAGRRFVASANCAKNDQDPTAYTTCQADLECEVPSMWVEEAPLG
jgi:hypothetical protein